MEEAEYNAYLVPAQMEIQHSLNGQADLGTQLLVPRTASFRAFEMVGSGNTGGVFQYVFSTS